VAATLREMGSSAMVQGSLDQHRVTVESKTIGADTLDHALRTEDWENQRLAA
jgi:hypothetical protein